MNNDRPIQLAGQDPATKTHLHAHLQPTTWVHWFYLVCAIVLEVAASTVMVLSHQWTFAHARTLGLGLMWLGIALSYISLARSTTGLPVGVAFAFWEGLGLVLVTISGFFILGEELSWQRCLGLACVLCGALLVNRGTSHGEPQPCPQADAQKSRSATADSASATATDANSMMRAS